MKKYLLPIILGFVFLGIASSQAMAQMSVIDSLTNPDPEIRKYFPRWRICETDLQIQIKQAFVIEGYDQRTLDISNIEVLAAPHSDPTLPYDVLLVSCGQASMASNKLSASMNRILEFISGKYSYKTNEEMIPAKRDYCFIEIPPEVPVTKPMAAAILSFMEPNNVNHAISLSLFEQSLKLGSTDFWLKSILGTDQIGYPFWEAGEGKVILKRPLYKNTDYRTYKRIPNLITAYLGGGYRITSGLDNTSSMLSWVSSRKLNSGPSGKLIAGFDFNMPFFPEAGIQFNIELPLETMKEKSINSSDYAKYYDHLASVQFSDPTDPRAAFQPEGIAPMLRATGQLTAFYNVWIDPKAPENYFRFDVGLNYNEVREVLCYRDNNVQQTKIAFNNVYGLKTYKPSEFGDWLYLKAEYRNQSTYPFGASMQYSNQILLSRIYLPIIGDWLYVEGKYSTPLRKARPYEIDNFFMISPVLRITI